MDNKELTPKIRFAGFTDPWEQRKLGDKMFIKARIGWQRLTKKEYLDSGEYYLITGTDIDEGSHTVDLSRSYYVSRERYEADANIQMTEGDIIVTKDGTIGKVAILNGLDKPATLNSHLFVLRDLSGTLDTQFLLQVLISPVFQDFVESTKTGSTLTGMPQKTIVEFSFLMPSLQEQKSIASLLGELDNLITLHQRKYEKLQNIKKSMLEKMFPRDGSNIPEVRFAGFTDPWEQRKFGELVLIERGGSPRPIDDYITDSPDGLNWIKIGDAPEHGRYINSTKEKIKPEGLSKTRQVQPGDLILSNSMSFGRPYIMGIHGCIHDGWLLIRDEQEKFDLTFLCHMLGTDQMLDQYRMYAAGSTVNNLNKELVGNTTVSIPSKAEQQIIGQFFEHIDDTITLHQRKLEKLKNIKKSMLESMFV